MSASTISPRRAMLDILASDLLAQGWDQNNKMWFMLGEPGDEYLEYIGSYDMEPEHWMLHRSEEGQLVPTIQGVVTCWESWTYPRSLSVTLDGPLLDAYAEILPPNQHPERKQVRTIVLVARDGAVMRVEHYSEAGVEPEFAEMVGHPLTGRTDEPLVDLIRSILGIAERPDKSFPTMLREIFAQTPGMVELSAQARAEKWPTSKLMAEVYRRSSVEVQAQMRDSMPPDVQKALLDD